jgi:hypothetical protein
MDSEDNVRKFHQKKGPVPASEIRDTEQNLSRIQEVKKHQISDPGSATLGVHMWRQKLCTGKNAFITSSYLENYISN